MVMRRLGIVVALLTVTLAAVPVSGARSLATTRLAGVEAQIVREINQVRAAQGLRPLRISAALQVAAVGHTRAMLREGFFAHDSLDGTSSPDRIARSYPMRPNRFWSVGETLFSTSGDLTPRGVVSAWLTSPSHRHILLAPQWREIGVGVLRDPSAGGDFGDRPATVATADFGTR
jgi:uncharacterized protein YkwD